MLQIEGVTKEYETHTGGTIVALQNINLNIQDEEFVTIIGVSGCGKSTLLKLIAGLITPTLGSIRLKGELVTRPRQDIGLAFQSAPLLPWRNVLDNVLLPIEVLNLPRNDYISDAYALLQSVGLARYATLRPNELSGGMQQRVAICRSLIHDPQLLLMDEPFGSLDALTRDVMSFELLRIWDQRKKTLLFVTHSITEAILLADRVIILTPRPGQVARTISITLPRPRHAGMESTEQFYHYSRELRSHLLQLRGEAD